MAWIRSILNLLPAIIGTLQSVLPILKEIVVDIVRLIAALPFLWSVADPIIEKINNIYDKIYDAIEKLKNFLLWIPE